MMSARGEQGFSLVEMLVTLVITTVIFGATLTVLDAFQRNNRNATLRNEAQDTARNVLDGLARGLRSVTAPTTKSPGALEQATAYSITFETVDTSQVAGGANASNAMRVRYCLSNSNPSRETLWKQVKRWTTAQAPEVPTATTCPDLNATDWDTSAQLVTQVTNRIGGQPRPLFVYTASATPQIVTVQTNLYVDLSPGTGPGETQLTSGVSLRNANRPPIVSFTATQIHGHVLLNASESRDPDGLALIYKWSDGSTTLPSTAQQYETGELTKGSSHTFTLEVGDPGRLSSSTSQTVTIL
jgi:prepilin-type N-terminal cleavage/methylation domain-containing protein